MRVGSLDFRREYAGLEVGAIKIETSWDERIIEQRISIGDQVQRNVLDTGEYHVRRALIAMGWTPPDKRHG